MNITMYTAVTERRCGSFLNNWMAKSSQYDAQRGMFGYKAEPIIYRTIDGDSPFCVVVFSKVQLSGWFETNHKYLIQPALNAINKTP